MGFGHRAIGLFADKEVMMAAARDLRQVGDAHYLGGFAKLAQQFAHYGGGRTADTHVHFIENQRRSFHFTGGDHLNRQRDTGKLAAGGHFRERLQRLPRVCGDAEIDAIGAFRCQMVLLKQDVNRELTVWHRQRMHTVGDELRQFAGIDHAAFMQRVRYRQRLLVVFVDRQGQRFQAIGLVVQKLLLFKQLLVERGQLFRGDLVLARKRVLTGDALLQLLQTVRVEIQTFAVVTQFVAGFAQLDGGLFKHIQHAGEFVIHADEIGHEIACAVELALQIGIFRVGQQV